MVRRLSGTGLVGRAFVEIGVAAVRPLGLFGEAELGHEDRHKVLGEPGRHGYGGHRYTSVSVCAVAVGGDHPCSFPGHWGSVYSCGS